jgi:hypothetical protein
MWRIQALVQQLCSWHAIAMQVVVRAKPPVHMLLISASLNSPQLATYVINWQWVQSAFIAPTAIYITWKLMLRYIASTTVVPSCANHTMQRRQ